MLLTAQQRGLCSTTLTIMLSMLSTSLLRKADGWPEAREDRKNREGKLRLMQNVHSKVQVTSSFKTIDQSGRGSSSKDSRD